MIRNLEWARALALAVLAAAPLCAQSVGELKVGHWIKVKGDLAPDGTLVASEVEVLAPHEQSLTGTIEEQRTPTRFVLLGQEVHVSSTTAWRGIAPGALKGARVKVEGDYHGPRKFSADVVARREPGRDALEGRIDRLEAGADGVLVGVMRFDVRIPASAKVTSARPLAELPLAPQRPVEVTPTQQRDEDDLLRGSLHVGDVTLGGQVEYKHDALREQDLDDSRPDERDDREGSLRLEAVWEPADAWFLLAGARLRDQRRIDADSPDEHDTAAVLTEAYVYWRDALGSGWDVQTGRQDFDERREWLYDQNLDALRLVRTSADLRVELSLSTSLSDASARDRDTTNWLAYVSNNDYDRHLAAYWLTRDDSGTGDLATHVGARAFGEWLPRSDVWAEVAYLSGETGAEEVGAFGLDVGATWQPWDDGPWFSAGFAHGSGGAVGETFRQTGLNDNTDKFGGASSFQYYGELLDPELSNLSILTLGVGAQLATRTSLDLVVHGYEQERASDRLVDSGLRRRPDGVHSRLGLETDLVLACKAVDYWLFEGVVGWFAPGSAFPGADDAWLFRVQLRYQF